jgi:ATP-dependent Clp protease adaptor protein ClpS
MLEMLTKTQWTAAPLHLPARPDRLALPGPRPLTRLTGPSRARPQMNGDKNGAGNSGGNDDGRTTTGVVIKTRPKVKKPSMYKVLMLNDDYTPMEFVVHVLERFFSKSTEEATRIMLHVHQRGVGVCGVYTFEVAETKVTQVMDLARKNQHPLQCTLEKE